MPRTFYRRNCLIVARALIGRVLVFDAAAGRVAGRIVETEAYRAATDAASHAFRGRTARNAVMFGEPGHAYVYFTYGMHHCLNLVTEPAGSAAAVLIRAIAPICGLDRMARRRRAADARLASGPGNLTRAFALTRAEDGLDLTRGRLWVSDLAADREGHALVRGRRIGIRQAVELPWRFYLEHHPSVSARGAAPRAMRPRARARAHAGLPR